MPVLTAYRLEPRAAFHFGERGAGIEESAETFRSDSLFGALCSVLREGWGQATLRELLNAFQEDLEPPFRISSCFPFAGPVRFFPRPVLPLPADPGPEAGKQLKSVRFVSEGLLRGWLAGEDLSGELPPENFLPASHAWVRAAERAAAVDLLPDGGEGDAALWAAGDVLRVTVDRRTSASAVYRCGRLVFQPGCGLQVLVDWQDESWRSRIEAALALLGDAGLGGRRSTGYGQFALGPAETVAFPDWAGAGWITLALYWPGEAELAAGVLGGPARFDLVTRGGWIGSPEGRALRRRTVRMIAEGSLLAGPAPPRGALADTTPAGFAIHPVYRYGLALPLPVRSIEVERG